MQQITKNELSKVLDNYLNKNIMLEISGFTSVKIKFKNFKYEIKNDEIKFYYEKLEKIKLKNNENEINITINFNNINFIGKEVNKTIFYIEDGKDTAITIEEE